MRILAIECTAAVASVALTEDDKLISLMTRNAGRTHSELLLPMIESMLQGQSLNVSDIDLFACAAGPGSFTGIRIGVSTIKGLAFGRGKPCVGVSALEAMAYGFSDSFDGAVIAPMMDARRGNVYSALFEARRGQAPQRLTEDALVPAAELAETLLSRGSKAVICGDGHVMLTRIIPEGSPIVTAPPELIYPSAYSVALCALDKYRRGECVSDSALSPIYLRPSQAEREAAERELK